MYYTMPELILLCGILLTILTGFFTRNKKTSFNALLAFAILVGSISYTAFSWHIYASPINLFGGLIRSDDFSAYFKILMDTGGLLTVLMSLRNKETPSHNFNSEYYSLILSAVLGAHLLVMSMNFITVFLSLELLSISAYVLAGYSFTKKGAEGSLKYFLFGSAASAIMLYGFSILFGITGTLDFASADFVGRLLKNQSALLIVAGFMALAGFLYKIAAAPMHPWSPDVYEAAPIPIVAFLSVVPKLAGIAILSKFMLAINLFGQSAFDWQLILAVIAMLTITVGNFSALRQNNPKRMIAYSSIAQAGFLLIGMVCFSIEGIHALLFYSTVYLISNFAVMVCLQAFEKNGVLAIPSFAGIGKSFILPSIVLLIGLISLSGIPPTGGFTSKLFVFASLWSAYEQTGKELLLWLLIFGLLNTVISLFYYLKIPYYSFLKPSVQSPLAQNTQFENFLALVLVVGVLFLFIRPDLLMGWLNTINFVF
jgi:NADH-quinone oxidoreductase subunit N